jgi:adenine-specific DNA-methyltransferase
MPTLNWIGKEAVVNHHLQVPFRLLKDVPDLSCGEPGEGNLIVQGDNLVALKALLPYYAGQVKCIYIDPPYNTGVDDRDEKGKRVGWIYSDNVNSLQIREWLRIDPFRTFVRHLVSNRQFEENSEEAGEYLRECDA